MRPYALCALVCALVACHPLKPTSASSIAAAPPAAGSGSVSKVPSTTDAGSYIYSPPGESKGTIFMVHGSEGGGGGNGPTETTDGYARALAAQGYTVYAACYFDCGDNSGKPADLAGVNVDNLSAAAATFKTQYGPNDPAYAVAWSRGTEALQLMGSDQFDRTTLIAPSPSVNGTFTADPSKTPPAGPAWTLDGKGVAEGAPVTPGANSTSFVYTLDNTWQDDYSAQIVQRQADQNIPTTTTTISMDGKISTSGAGNANVVIMDGTGHVPYDDKYVSGSQEPSQMQMMLTSIASGTLPTAGTDPNLAYPDVLRINGQQVPRNDAGAQLLGYVDVADAAKAMNLTGAQLMEAGVPEATVDEITGDVPEAATATATATDTASATDTTTDTATATETATDTGTDDPNQDQDNTD